MASKNVPNLFHYSFDYSQYKAEIEWEKENRLDSQAQSFFAKTATWFRHSDYELYKSENGQYYITPKPDATYEKYDPFDEYPYILGDFLSLLIEISSNNWTYKDEELLKAKALLKFTKKYGPMGLFWENFREALYTGDDNKILFVKKYCNFDEILCTEDLENILILYKDYVKNFFPKLSANYPYINDKNETATFFNNYSEDTLDVFSHKKFINLMLHFKDLVTFESHEYDFNSFANLNFEYWHERLNFDLLETRIKLVYENNEWKLSWNYYSLLDALSVMYILNLTGQFGQKLNVCQLDECNNIVIDQKYCSIQHGNTHRKRRERHGLKTALQK